ncbi:substrate-binding periplasmic protein [Bacterioplanoides sp.]|uniref:substrate-binding periplasmic protein n=1 Tax=Bacterioplanoides sp. TaxID=2066072 RepID=UPI003B00C9DE
MRSLPLLLFALLLMATSFSAYSDNTSLDGTSSDLPLRLCTLDHWPPFVDRSALKGGWAVQVVDEALQLAAIPFQRSYVPWARAVELTQGGRCDAITELYHDPQREHWVHFSDRYGALSMTLFAHAEREVHFSKLADLSKYRIGMLRGANISPEFHRTPNLQLVPLNSVQQGVKLTYHQRIDGFITGEKAIRFAMYQLQPQLPDITTRLKPVKPVIHQNELFVGFNKLRAENREWRQRFNQALKMLINSGRYQQILEEQHLVNR